MIPFEDFELGHAVRGILVDGANTAVRVLRCGADDMELSHKDAAACVPGPSYPARAAAHQPRPVRPPLVLEREGLRGSLTRWRSPGGGFQSYTADGKRALIKFDGATLFPERIAYGIPCRPSEAKAHPRKDVADYIPEESNNAGAQRLYVEQLFEVETLV